MMIDSITKTELIRKFADQHHIHPSVSEDIVNSILHALVRALRDDQRIEIRGFGSFEIRTRAPRKARNPRTGETVMTTGSRLIHFKPGKDLKERVDQKKPPRL
jgi:integration host factor subunit beta